MVRRISFCIATILLWARGGATETLTEADYLAALTAQHPAAIVLEEPLSLAAGEARRARTLGNPDLEIDREAPGDTEQLTFGLRWRLPLDGRRGLHRLATLAGVDAAQQTLDWNRLELRAELRAAYADWALAGERRACIQAHLASMRAIVDKTEERWRAGEASGLTAQRLSLALVEMEASSARAEADLEAARALALYRIEAAEDDAQPQLPPLPVPGSDLDPNIDRHPSLGARRAEVREAEASARLARRPAFSPEVRAGWQSLRQADADTDGWVLGASLELPLFERRQGERIASAGRLRAAKARLEVDERRARAALAAASTSYATLRRAALAADRSLEDNDDILERASARFRMGESDVTEFLDTLQSLLSSRLTALDLYADALAAHRRLELAAGRTVTDTGGGR